MNSRDHRVLRDRRDDAIFYRCRRRDAQRVTVHASFAKELAGLQDCDDRFLALLRHDSKLDLAPLNVKNRVRDIALLEHMLVLVKFEHCFPRAHLGEKYFGVKYVLGWLLHRSLLWLNEL